MEHPPDRHTTHVTIFSLLSPYIAPTSPLRSPPDHDAAARPFSLPPPSPYTSPHFRELPAWPLPAHTDRHPAQAHRAPHPVSMTPYHRQTTRSPAPPPASPHRHCSDCSRYARPAHTRRNSSADPPPPPRARFPATGY